MRATQRPALDFNYSPFKVGRVEASIFKPGRGFDTLGLCCIISRERTVNAGAAVSGGQAGTLPFMSGEGSFPSFCA